MSKNIKLSQPSDPTTAPASNLAEALTSTILNTTVLTGSLLLYPVVKLIQHALNNDLPNIALYGSLLTAEIAFSEVALFLVLSYGIVKAGVMITHILSSYFNNSSEAQKSDDELLENKEDLSSTIQADDIALVAPLELEPTI